MRSLRLPFSRALRRLLLEFFCLPSKPDQRGVDETTPQRPEVHGRLSQQSAAVVQSCPNCAHVPPTM